MWGRIRDMRYRFRTAMVVSATATVAAAVAINNGRVAARQGLPDVRPDVVLTEPWSKPVPRAECGKGDRIENALQGQTTIAERMTGEALKAYNCNLELVGQFQGEGATWQM